MTNIIDAPNRQVRFIELDSLRGLAAITVVVGHLEGANEVAGPPGSVIRAYSAALAISFAAEAVILFFVLSGFVLALPAVDGRPQSYFTFVTRRIFRIYVPYLAALAVSVAAALYFRGQNTSEWVLEFWSGSVSWRMVWQHVTFLGVYDTLRFDPPIWSLVYEMRISLFFPLLCSMILRFKNRWAFALAIFLTTLASALDEKYPSETMIPLADTLHYTAMFVLGICLARERTRIASWFSRISRPARISFAIASLLLLAFAAPLTTRIFHLEPTLFTQWLTVLGAGAVIVVCLNSRSCKRILRWPPILLLGQMSYSLYLTHFIVLLCCVYLLFGRIPLSAILCVAFAASVVVSWLSYRFIEIPSITHGRRLSNAFRSPSGGRPSGA